MLEHHNPSVKNDAECSPASTTEERIDDEDAKKDGNETEDREESNIPERTSDDEISSQADESGIEDCEQGEDSTVSDLDIKSIISASDEHPSQSQLPVNGTEECTQDEDPIVCNSDPETISYASEEPSSQQQPHEPESLESSSTGSHSHSAKSSSSSSESSCQSLESESSSSFVFLESNLGSDVDVNEGTSSPLGGPPSLEHGNTESVRIEAENDGDSSNIEDLVSFDSSNTTASDTASVRRRSRRRRDEADIARIRTRDLRRRMRRRRNYVLNIVCLPCMFVFTLFVVLMLVIFMGLPFAMFLFCLLTAYYCCTSDPLPPRVLIRALMDTDDWNGTGGHTASHQRRFNSKHEIETELIQRICLGNIKFEGTEEELSNSARREKRIGQSLQSVERTHADRVHWKYEQDQCSDGIEVGKNVTCTEYLVFSEPLSETNRSEITQQVRDFEADQTTCSDNKTPADVVGDIEAGNASDNTEDADEVYPFEANAMQILRLKNAEKPVDEDDFLEDETSVRERGAMCDICLINFEAGDVIAWSSNPSCDHAYHSDCISDWLLRQPTCPSCRQEYLPPVVSADGNHARADDNPIGIVDRINPIVNPAEQLATQESLNNPSLSASSSESRGTPTEASFNTARSSMIPVNEDLEASLEDGDVGPRF